MCEIICVKKESAASCFAAIWSFIFHDQKAVGGGRLFSHCHVVESAGLRTK